MKNFLFILQITENRLRVVKCLIANGNKCEFLALEEENMPSDAADKAVIEKAGHLLKKLGYSREAVVVCLPRAQATCRYIKIPTHSFAEIEKIFSLQAPRYLPYPAEELITGYQVISKEKDGYSNINLIIAHKSAIERYIKIFEELKVINPKIILSSYGLANLCQRAGPEENNILMIVDIDQQQIEVALTCKKKLLFSRAFKFSGAVISDEINKTRDAYLKETGGRAPDKIIVTGISSSKDFIPVLSRDTGITAEALSYDKLGLADNLLNKALTYGSSFASVIGLGLRDLDDSLNLLPAQVKDGVKKIGRQKEALRISGFICAIILVLALAAAKNLDNKRIYLKQLKTEIAEISSEAKPLEEIENRLEFIKERSKKGVSGLDILYELQKEMPGGASLISLTYEQDKHVILHGQASELSRVFEFVARLEKSAVFKNFNVKVRYATKKRIQAGEIIDFEILCTKR